MNLWRRSIILLTLFCTFTQSVNQLHWSETIDLTISQMAFSFSCYVWQQSNMVHEKIDCNTSYMQTICSISCCLVRQQWRLMVMPVISITGIFLIHQSWTLPLYGFWLWIMSAGNIALTKKPRVSSPARWLCMYAPLYCKWLLQSLSCNCSQYAMSCHQVDVTSSQSNSQCLLNII